MPKLIQINVQGYSHFDDLVDYLAEQNADIINIQESVDGDIWTDAGFRKDYIRELSENLGMNYVDHLSVGRSFDDHDIGLGVAVLSRYPIIDYKKSILNGARPQVYPHDYGMFVEKDKHEKYKYAFRIPLGCLTTLLDMDGTVVRNITAHFHVSYECTETENHITDAEHIIDILNGSSDLPVLFSGDLNIHSESATIHMLTKELTHHTSAHLNTLSKRYHPIFVKQPEHPGHSVDHVFSRHVSVHRCFVDSAEVSDHYPVVCEFELS